MSKAQKEPVMNYKNSFAKIVLFAITFWLVACGTQPTPEPTSIKLATATSIPPTETPTLTPTQTPTNTPTITPTPIGGVNGLLLFDNPWQPKIYTYNANLHKTSLFLEGYSPVGVSPDGKEVALLKTDNAKTDLFIVDFAKPEQIVLLHENVKDAVWLYGTEWISFIAVQDGIRQVFIVHPDGSNLTQVTKSVVGAVTLSSVFNDGVFWGEGTVSNNGSTIIRNHKWTKLDGTETTFINFITVSPSGNLVFISPEINLNLKCWDCNLELINVATSEKKKVSLSNMTQHPDSLGHQIQPLSDDKWLLEYNSFEFGSETFLFDSNGNVLLNFADLPHHHDPLPENAEKVDEYLTIGQLSEQHLSPDGNLLVIQHFMLFTKKPLNYEVSYYVLNLATLEIQELPGLLFTSKDGTVANNGRFIDGVTDGFRISQFFWIEMP